MDKKKPKRRHILLLFFVVLSVYEIIKNFHKNTLAFVLSLAGGACFIYLYGTLLYYRFHNSPTESNSE